MSRGKTLVALLTQYRSEIRASVNPAHNNQVRDTQVELLQRTQEILWEDYNWPHLRIEREYAGAAGQRLYDFGTDFDIDRIEQIYFKDGGEWHPLTAGIGPQQYAVHDSDLDQRSFPVRRWRIYEGEQVEIWPTSDQDGEADTLNGYFKVKGIRKLSPLVEDDDTADLDDRMIVLFAAAETLGASGAKDAARKLELANRRYKKLTGNLTPRRKFSMFGIHDTPPRRRHMITAYRAPGT